MEFERDDISPEEVSEILDAMIEAGYIVVVGISKDGDPLYKFSEELLAMEEFAEVHEAITNDILFSIWNKGFIEMNPLNEDGDWNVSLNDKSHDHELAKKELEEDEFILFLQIYVELSQEF